MRFWGSGKLLSAGRVKGQQWQVASSSGYLLGHFTPGFEGVLLVVSTLPSGDSGAGGMVKVGDADVEVE